MLIAVTRTDCDLGMRGRCGHCPVALALNRATGRPDDDGWHVEFDRCKLEYGPRDAWFLLPPEVGAWVRIYDAGGAAGEIEFQFGYEPAERAA